MFLESKHARVTPVCSLPQENASCRLVLLPGFQEEAEASHSINSTACAGENLTGILQGQAGS